MEKESPIFCFIREKYVRLINEKNFKIKINNDHQCLSYSLVLLDCWDSYHKN